MLTKSDMGFRFVQQSGRDHSLWHVRLLELSEDGSLARVRWLCFRYWTKADSLSRVAGPKYPLLQWVDSTFFDCPDRTILTAVGLFLVLAFIVGYLSPRPKFEPIDPPGDRSVRMAAKP